MGLNQIILMLTFSRFQQFFCLFFLRKCFKVLHCR